MVLMAGLEPARPKAGDFKSPVSAIPPHQRVHIILTQRAQTVNKPARSLSWKKVLTNYSRWGIINIAGLHGEMAEWFKALVLKTSDAERHRGFESLSLRQSTIA